jgi:hypothetical protein
MTRDFIHSISCPVIARLTLGFSFGLSCCGIKCELISRPLCRFPTRWLGTSTDAERSDGFAFLPTAEQFEDVQQRTP